MMFNRFTQRSQKVLQLAQEEAIRLKHEAIGTEHILLGLIREGNGIAAKALEASNVDPKAIDLDSDLEYWVQLCLDYNPKAKSSKKK